MTALELAAAPAEWALVERAQAGDMAAFEQIYRTHRVSVEKFVYFRTGSQQLTEDLCQDVWVKALRSIGTVTWQGRGIAAWLLTIARNRVTDYFKSARLRTSSHRTIDDLIADRTEPVAADDPVNEVAQAIEDEAARLLFGALLSELTPDQQQVVRLRFWEELSTAEAAAVMGKQVGAVKAAQYRACSSLRRSLGGAR